MLQWIKHCLHWKSSCVQTIPLGNILSNVQYVSLAVSETVDALHTWFTGQSKPVWKKRKLANSMDRQNVISYVIGD